MCEYGALVVLVKQESIKQVLYYIPTIWNARVKFCQFIILNLIVNFFVFLISMDNNFVSHSGLITTLSITKEWRNIIQRILAIVLIMILITLMVKNVGFKNNIGMFGWYIYSVGKKFCMMRMFILKHLLLIYIIYGLILQEIVFGYY